MFINVKPILAVERVLHKDYDHKGSVTIKKTLVVILKGLGTKMSCLAVNNQS
jgi:hypothetical protein